jgi:hypothetical protein
MPPDRIGSQLSGEEVAMKSALKHVRYVLGSVSAVLFASVSGGNF